MKLKRILSVILLANLGVSFLFASNGNGLKNLQNPSFIKNVKRIYNKFKNKNGLSSSLLYKKNFNKGDLKTQYSYVFSNFVSKFASGLPEPGKKVMTIVYLNPNVYKTYIANNKLTSDDIKVIQMLQMITILSGTCNNPNNSLYKVIYKNKANTIIWQYVYNNGTAKENKEKSFEVIGDQNSCKALEILGLISK